MSGLLNSAQDRETIGLGMAVGFSALAGAVDACGLVRLHDRFVSFMSGNTTTMGVALGQGDLAKVAGIAPLILWFVLGAALGTVLAIRAGRRPLPVVATAVLALLLVPLVMPGLSAVGMALAMGALNAAMHRAGEVRVSLSYVTGTLVKVGQGLGGLLCGQRVGVTWLVQAVPWVGMLAGGTAAGWMQLRFGPHIFWPVAVFAALLAAVAWQMPQPDGTGTTA